MTFNANQSPFSTQKFMSTILLWLKSNTELGDAKYHNRGIYLANDNGPASPIYPFATYDWITTHKRLPFTDNTTNEIFEMTIKFDAHATNTNDANDLAEQLYSLLNSYHFDDYAVANGFVVVDVTSPADTTNFISVQVERSIGFAVVLRTRNNFDDDYDPIEDVNVEQSK